MVICDLIVVVLDDKKKCIFSRLSLKDLNHKKLKIQDCQQNRKILAEYILAHSIGQYIKQE